MFFQTYSVCDSDQHLGNVFGTLTNYLDDKTKILITPKKNNIANRYPKFAMFERKYIFQGPSFLVSKIVKFRRV